MEFSVIYISDGTLTYYDVYGTDELLEFVSNITNSGCYILGYVEHDNGVGYHQSLNSALYDDTGYVEDVQETDILPLGEKYFVLYFVESGGDLLHCVDRALSPEQIQHNIVSGRYREGASYYKLSQLNPISNVLIDRR